MVFESISSDPVKKYKIVKLDRKFQTLENEVQQLKEKREWLEQSVDKAHRNGEEVYSSVVEWLGVAFGAIKDAKELVQRKEAANLKPSSLKALHQLSKDVETAAWTIKNLQNEHRFRPVSLPPPLQQLTGPCVALPSRVMLVQQVMGSLRDPGLNMIGVYGIGGVGKTALLEEVRVQGIQEKLFKIVVMVSVSRATSLRRMQAEIADFFGLKLETGDVSLRASLLRERLNKSQVLVILDDLWEKLDLNDVGIPTGKECSACKVLLCSRKKDVLCCEMATQKAFSLNVLEDEEALDLFHAALPNTKDLKLQTLATDIAKKCAGLPLLVKIVVHALQNNNTQTAGPNAWDCVLEQLSVFGSDERVHKVVESSFESLPGEEEKSLFLLCALFEGSRIPMEHLLICSIGLDLLAGMDTVGEARNRLMALINNLKERRLLEKSHDDGYLKIQGMVHDVAIAIASKLQHAFIGAGQERMRGFPSNNCTRISIQHCDAMEFGSGVSCPMAELFLLSTDDACLQIPDLFFEGITGLKVVSISGMCFGSGLPSSLGFLENLQCLCLNGCQMNDVAAVTKLKRLQILSFANSNIVELPRELGDLTKLKLLDLRNCADLKVIPAGVISNFSRLEELYMLNSFIGWNKRGNARLFELENLDCLSTLELQTLDTKLRPRNFKFFSTLKNYKISIGDKWVWDGKYETSRTLKIKLKAGIGFEDGIQMLERTQELYINTLMGIKSVFYRGLPKLKHLHIGYDDGVRHLLNSIARTSQHGFRILKSLNVYNSDPPEKAYVRKDEESIIT